MKYTHKPLPPLAAPPPLEPAPFADFPRDFPVPFPLPLLGCDLLRVLPFFPLPLAGAGAATCAFVIFSTKRRS